MNDSAVEYLQGLKSQIERADMLSIQTVSWSFIDEALSLIVPTAAIYHAAYAAKAACEEFHQEMRDNSFMPPTSAIQNQRRVAADALDTLRDLVAPATPSDKATILHIP